ncbi:YwqG family protein [Streptomyces sp. NPDC048629]|uniref:YwqG family protein n=1 Tax=Streptomyces sp. NPDC048629 TaxID=3154824 RepID=UPI00342B905D
MADHSILERPARELSPEDVASAWPDPIRPGLRLRPAYASDVVVGRIGGDPQLPEHLPWPTWEGYGPLTFVASIDCSRVPADVQGLGLPEDGTLLFFLFDARIDVAWFDLRERDLRGVSRVLHVPANSPVRQRATPAEITPHPLTALAVRGLESRAECDAAPLHCLGGRLRPPHDRVRLLRLDGFHGWGDAGAHQWLIRPEDLTAGRLDATVYRLDHG